MVKFTKDGSTATTAALKLARASTGRDMVAVCAEHPFFSYDDWFIVTTTMDGGIPRRRGGDDDALPATTTSTASSGCSPRTPERIAAVFLEPARTEPPRPGFLEGVRELCTDTGHVLVFDEMITGFRYDVRGAQHLYGVTPDLSTFGKAMANGFSLSALCGKRELMRLGSRERDRDDVFLLSTTHGAETTALAAAMCTMEIYEREPVIEHLYRQGDAWSPGCGRLPPVTACRITSHPSVSRCNLVYSTLDADGQPSQSFRTLFLQETIRRGVLMPSLVVSYSHADADIDRTIEAIDGALDVYAKALVDGPERFLVGPPSRHVFDRRFRCIRQRLRHRSGRHLIDESRAARAGRRRRRSRRRRGPNARRCRAGCAPVGEVEDPQHRELSVGDVCAAERSDTARGGRAAARRTARGCGTIRLRSTTSTIGSSTSSDSAIRSPLTRTRGCRPTCGTRGTGRGGRASASRPAGGSPASCTAARRSRTGRSR